MIGRKLEQEELLRRYRRNKPEFVAVYGRRGIGKTTLIAETFQKKFAFHHTGLAPAGTESEERKSLGSHLSEIKKQLKHFYHALMNYGLRNEPEPETWLDAFYLLEELLTQQNDGSRQVVFLDELPWMDTPRSGFVTALEGFWNRWGCMQKDLMLIVSGSAASWMRDKLINHDGGLYNRVTCEIKLSPFTLHECQLFLQSNNVRFSPYDIAECYMILGGIPFYLDALHEELSLTQNIDHLFFEQGAVLQNELDRLFNSIFVNPDRMTTIVTTLNQRCGGYTRKELSENTGLSGKTLTDCMRTLIASDFVERYVPFSEGKRETHYRLIDPFCQFYLHFVKEPQTRDDHFWMHQQASQSVVSWRGLAFENLCFCHIQQIKQALGIGAVHTNQFAWLLHGDDHAQIDLIIERDDRVINACEIRFCSDELIVDKAYYRKLQSRQSLLIEKISRKQSIHQTLISTYGLKRNEYSGIFTQVITLDDLFRE